MFLKYRSQPATCHYCSFFSVKNLDLIFFGNILVFLGLYPQAPLYLCNQYLLSNEIKHLIWLTSTRPPTEDGQKYMLAFRNLGLVTPCPRLAPVFYLFRNLKKRFLFVNSLCIDDIYSKHFPCDKQMK